VTDHQPDCHEPSVNSADIQWILENAHRLRPALLRFGRKLGVDGDDAEDIVSDLIVRLPSLWPRGGDVTRPYSFLCGCLRRDIANFNARRKRRAACTQRLLGEGLFGVEGSTQVRLDCEWILNRLPPNEAQLLKLRYLRGWSVAELAARMELSEGATRARLHRSLLKAREVLYARKAAPPIARSETEMLRSNTI
jgi:RNA polymerase sigma-70 factor (ECF subfamily)